MSDHHLIALVDKATSEYLIQTDWTVNLQICDTLNREGNPMLDVVRHTTKRMKEKKSRVSLYAIELLETLVKNCENVHVFVGGNECQAELIKLIQNKKTKDQVKERALELVQYWADSFSSRRDLPQFNQTFMLLRRAGIPFPPRRKDEPPLVFKNAPAAAAPAAPQARPVSQGPSNPRSESSSNLKGDLTAVQENVNLAMEMLAYTNPEEEDPSANEILKELITTCKDVMPSVRSTIESANFSSDAQMVSLLALNDELVKVQEMYDDLIARRHKATPPPSNDILDLASAFGSLNTHTQAPPPLHPPSYQSATTTSSNSGPLDDFDFLSGPTTTPTKATTPYPPLPTQSQQQQQQQQSYVNPFFESKPPTANAPGTDVDEFDLFARGRHSVTIPTPLPAMGSPLQPSKTGTQPAANLYFPPANTSSTNLYSNTTSNPYNLPTNTTTSVPNYNISSTSTLAPNPYNSVPLATSPPNQLYNSNNVNAPRATSPINPYNNANAPRATSPINPYNTNPQGYAPATGAPFFPSYPQGNYLQPQGQQQMQPNMQPMQPNMQPMQPMQPNMQPQYNPYNQQQNPSYSLPAGGYRPQ